MYQLTLDLRWSGERKRSYIKGAVGPNSHIYSSHAICMSSVLKPITRCEPSWNHFILNVGFLILMCCVHTSNTWTVQNIQSIGSSWRGRSRRRERLRPYFLIPHIFSYLMQKTFFWPYGLKMNMSLVASWCSNHARICIFSK